VAGCAEAKAFALLSEEGIAKGIRRVVAVTAGEAQEAIAAGELLTERIVIAGRLPPLQLERELGALKAVRQESQCKKSRCKNHTAYGYQQKTYAAHRMHHGRWRAATAAGGEGAGRTQGGWARITLQVYRQQYNQYFCQKMHSQVVGNAVIPAVVKAGLCMEISALTKGRLRRRVTNPSLRCPVLDIAIFTDASGGQHGYPGGDQGRPASGDQRSHWGVAGGAESESCTHHCELCVLDLAISLLQAVYNTVIPEVVKPGLRAEISALTRASLEAPKRKAIPHACADRRASH